MAEWFAHIDGAASLLLTALWPPDASARAAIGLLLVGALMLACAVYLPLLARLVSATRLRREIEGALDDTAPHDGARDAERASMAGLFEASRWADTWDELERRRRASRMAPDAAPVRLAEVFEERPLLGAGVRRNLLDSLPSLLLGLAILLTLAQFTQVIGSATLLPTPQAAIEAPAMAADGGAGVGFADLSQRVALALHTALWGLLLSMTAALAARGIEGRFEARELDLDALVALAEPSSEVLRAGARPSSSESGEARADIKELTEDLVRAIRGGVGDQLGELHKLLQRTSEHQSDLTGGLALTLTRLSEDSDAHRNVTEAMNRAALSIRSATEGIADSAAEFEPVMHEMREISNLLEQTSSSLQEGQSQTRESIDALTQMLQEVRDREPSGPAALRAAQPAAGAGYAAALQWNTITPPAPTAPVPAESRPEGSLSGLLRTGSGTPPADLGPSTGEPAERSDDDPGSDVLE